MPAQIKILFCATPPYSTLPHNYKTSVDYTVPYFTDTRHRLDFTWHYFTLLYPTFTTLNKTLRNKTSCLNYKTSPDLTLPYSTLQQQHHHMAILRFTTTIHYPTSQLQKHLMILCCTPHMTLPYFSITTLNFDLTVTRQYKTILHLTPLHITITVQNETVQNNTSPCNY